MQHYIQSLLTQHLFCNEPLQEKIECIAKELYHAAGVEYSEAAEASIEKYTRMGLDKLPICMAKTQYSFSHEAAKKGTFPCHLCSHSLVCVRINATRLPADVMQDLGNIALSIHGRSQHTCNDPQTAFHVEPTQFLFGRLCTSVLREAISQLFAGWCLKMETSCLALFLQADKHQAGSPA